MSGTGIAASPRPPVGCVFAGDDARAQASMSAFIESIRLRPLDTGDLTMAHWLGGAGLLMMGLGRCGVGNFGFSLRVNLPAERTPPPPAALALDRQPGDIIRPDMDT